MFLSVYHITLTVNNHIHLLTQFVKIANYFWKEPNFVGANLHFTFSYVLKQEGHVALDHSPEL